MQNYAIIIIIIIIITKFVQCTNSSMLESEAQQSIHDGVSTSKYSW